MSGYFEGGLTNHVLYTFRDPESGERGEAYREKYSEAKAIYYGLYCNESNVERSLEK